MKKYVPFIFPAVALVIVLFLGYRWYVAQTTKPDGQISANGEGVKIENLSTDEANKMQGSQAKDLPSVELKSSEGTEGAGQVRYELKNDKVYFSVNGDLPVLKEGKYQVWLRQGSSDTKTKAFVLKESKSGYMGSAAFPSNMLPLEVVVSKEMTDDDQMETVVLTGTIQKQ